jgi:exopolysaccharide biosynthesis polyprenyl glycosylphosphotransferase
MGRGHAATIAGSLAVWIAVFLMFGLLPFHRLVHRLSNLDEMRRTVAAASLGVVLITLGSAWWQKDVSRLSVGLTWLLVVVLELGTREAWSLYRARLKADGRLAYRTLIVGTNEEAHTLAETLGAPGSGFTPVGFVAASVPAHGPYSLPLVGWIDDLDQAISDHEADCLVIVPTGLRTEEMRLVMQSARRAGVDVQTSLNIPETLASRLTVQNVGPGLILSMQPVRFTRTQALGKRAFDIMIASLVLLDSQPARVHTALAIRLTSRGPALFRQERVTKGGRQFKMYKFRTMTVDADRLLEEHAIDPTQPFFKLNGDHRLTSVGRLLRTLSVDELPQLLNVLKGDMSLVGPRPLPAEQVAANLELLTPRHEVLAGMTGWWQVNGRRDVDPDEALRLDQFYIENWSLGLDIFILAKTVAAVITRRGAF